jgi:nitrogen fixation/metabolism regulation signal transduction histidine kinase
MALLVLGSWLGFAAALRSSAGFRLRTLSNLLSALREGDYSFRVRGAGWGDPYGEVIQELNAVAEALRRQRVGDLEAEALLRKVMAEIDLVVVAFDHRQRLLWLNNAGEKLLGEPAVAALGRPAEALGLAPCLEGDPVRTVSLNLGGSEGRWALGRGLFRQQGRPHHLVVLSDVSRALREEELAAWKRLIRVIGHELNNSLAPIKSLAGSLEKLVTLETPPDDWQTDLEQGLRVISSRAEALNRFMGAYSRLAKMPDPVLTEVEIGPCVRRVVAMVTRLKVDLEEGPGLVVQADPDQLEQTLINLVRNAVDASLETGGRVVVGWRQKGSELDVFVLDEGKGLADTTNLFVPFFTTKSGGSGIGLFLCRQIAEAHGGRVTLKNRTDGPGCEAHLLLPGARLSPQASTS